MPHEVPTPVKTKGIPEFHITSGGEIHVRDHESYKLVISWYVVQGSYADLQ